MIKIFHRVFVYFIKKLKSYYNQVSKARVLPVIARVLDAEVPQVIDQAAFRIYANHPKLNYTEYVHANINAMGARFDRFGIDNSSNVCTPGVRVNFRSDATRIKMFINYREPCRDDEDVGCGRFGLEVDGILFANNLGSSIEGGPQIYSIFNQAKPKPHDFSLIFPYTPAVVFKGLYLSGGILLDPPPKRPPFLYVAYGDSITQGTSASTVTNTYPYLLARQMGWSVINMGFGGQRTTAEDGTQIGLLGGNLVTLAIGVNDTGSRSLADVERNYTGLLENLRSLQPAVPIFVITPLWVWYEDRPNGLGLYPEDYRNIIRTVVMARNDPKIYLVEGPDLVPHDDIYFFDGYHPNDAGFALYAQHLADAINKVLHPLQWIKALSNGNTLWSTGECPN